MLDWGEGYAAEGGCMRVMTKACHGLGGQWRPEERDLMMVGGD